MLRTAFQQAQQLLRQQAAVTCKQQIRNAVVIRRMYPPRLAKIGKFRRSLKRREYVYIVDEDTTHAPAGNLDVILTQDLEGLGLTGDVVTVTKRLARNNLLPGGFALYASPENVEKYEEEREANSDLPRISDSARRTMQQLQGMNLPIIMNPNVPWTLNKTHVRVSFRQVGVHVPEECITMPMEPITEPGDLQVKVTVNDVKSVPVKAVVCHYDRKNDIYPTVNVWSRSKKNITESAAT